MLLAIGVDAYGHGCSGDHQISACAGDSDGFSGCAFGSAMVQVDFQLQGFSFNGTVDVFTQYKFTCFCHDFSFG